MKKSFISLGLIVAATFALTNCAKELENPSQQPESAGIPFEITASTPDTKTANDGFNTVWVADDAVNVFHAEKGSSTYVSDGEFTLTSGASFTGKITEVLTADEYDWYVYYPYSNYNKTPAGTSSQNFSYQSIAQSSSGSQQQNGYDNMAHLSGNRFPMYGKATVAKDGDVNVSMNHLVAVAEIAVTNANTDPLLVTDVTFTSEQNIVGTFYVDFTGNEPDFAEGDNVSKTASLTVSNGTEIAKDGTAKFYIAFKPFTATAGQKLTIAVNGYSKEITLPADVEFKAGKIKKLNFKYNELSSVTWDLTTGTYVSESAESVMWESDYVGMTLTKEESSTPANNYLGGMTVNDQTYYHTRIYKGHKLSFVPEQGYEISKIVFESTTDAYASSFKDDSDWVNAVSVCNGKLVSAVPLDGKSAVDILINVATRFTIVKVYYVVVGEYSAPTLTSISVEGNTKKSFALNEVFSFNGKVIANYSDGYTANITSDAEFSGFDSSSVGNKTMTVSYGGKSTTYDIEVTGGTTYERYTGELVEGDYLIVYDGAAMKSVVSSSRLSYAEVSINNDAVLCSDSSLEWHIAKSGEYWTIYNASVDKYAASTGADNKAQLLANGTDDKSLWTASGTATYEFVNKANTGNKNLRRNGTYGFACYGTSTGGALTLYKKN